MGTISAAVFALSKEVILKLRYVSVVSALPVS